MKKLSKLTTLLFYISLIGIIISIIIIKYFSTKIEPSLKKFSINETRRIITLIINDSITKDISNLNKDNLLHIEKNNENEITTIDLDTNEINKLKNSLNKTIQTNLELVERGKINNIDKYFKEISDIDYEKIKEGVIYYIPMGNISGHILTNNLGPKIPIKFNLAGNVISDIESNIKEYGINNAMIEVKVKVKVTMAIHMPYVSNEVTIKTTIPIIMRIIQGNIPEYYFNPTSSN